MKKHTYRSKKSNAVRWSTLKERLGGKPAVLALDIAKENQYALLTNADDSVFELFRWCHPEETPAVLTELAALACPLTVVMESTGTYGDALRHQFRRLGFAVDQVSAKRVADAREIYDGVPSLHDAKSATVITRLYRAGLSRPWRESNETERTLDALRREFDLHQGHYQRNQNRLEAYLSRHWPEVLTLLPLDSVTLESLLIAYGTPADLAQDGENAREQLGAWSRHHLDADTIDAVLHSAATTLGQPCIAAERRYLQALAEELRHSRLAQKAAKAALEAHVDADAGLAELAATLGRVTTAVLLSCRLDPRHFANAHGFQKALGLNLKEKSSGRYVGQLKLTKRGSSVVRRYLYFAALRLIRNDAVIHAWFQRKAVQGAKNKTVIALMRKLAKALWYLGRGQRFDARKLVTV
jgi:transposase